MRGEDIKQVATATGGRAVNGHYANKDHVHKPKKGKGSYTREPPHEDWTEEEEEAWKELEKKLEKEKQ